MADTRQRDVPRGKPRQTQPTAHDWIDGRRPENHRMPGAIHTYSAAPNLEDLIAQSGLSDEEVRERLATQGYGPGIIARLENQPLPRVVSSRISACLGLRHDLSRGEVW